MPPPKKPKSGRTSLEQFLSEEERVSPLHYARSPRDSEGNSLRESEGSSPAGSVADFEGSDGEVFDGTKHLCSEIDMRINQNHEELLRNQDREILLRSQEREKLLQRLFRKSVSVDEQKVPGSPDREVPSPTSSPTSEQDRGTAFKRFEEHVKIRMERSNDADKYNSSNEQKYINCDMQRNAELSDSELKVNLNTHIDTKLSNEQGRLIDTLVASALASSAAQSIIYAQRPAQVGSVSTYTNGHNLSHSTMKNFDSQPRDLSKRSEADGKLLNLRLYENIHKINGNAQQSYHDWSKDAAAERNKHYLESHRHIVGLLSEREEDTHREQDRTPVQIMEKENIVQSVPARYPNSFFNPQGINGVIGSYSRYEHHQRETLGRAIGKIEDASSVMPSGNGYMPVHSMMPQTAAAGQSPTSTTMDLADPRDRFHPAFINPHLMMDSRRLSRENGHGNNVNKLCQVCSDNASGFHYGVWSCEGCKAFFKRSIQGPVDYVCPATNTCTIDKHRRKSCQACRLRKCYEVGMNKGSQRKDRKSSGSVTSKCQKRPRSENNISNGCPTPAKNSRKSRTSIILEALGKADLPSLESYHDHNLPPTRVHLLNSLVKLAERELVFLINWAKNVPGYTDLSLGDQVHLIECCWMELLLLNCAFRSMEHGGQRLTFAPDLVLERPYWSTVGMGDVLEQVGAVSEQMVQYNLHKEELLLLQATVLANAEVRKLASYSKLHEIQQTLLDGLVDIAQKYHPDNLRHIPSILLLLTHIRQAAGRATSYFQSLKKEGSVNFCDLLTEMLEAQSDDKLSTLPSPSS